MTLPAQPIFFTPIYKETIWGGNAFASSFKRPVSLDRKIGESWEIVSHARDQSAVAPGAALAGETLGSLVEKYGSDLLGACGESDKFPLLVKFIDAQDSLSVQVHPDDQQARTNGWGEFGKTECWYIVDAQENASIIVGFNQSVTKTRITGHIEDSSLQKLLNFIPVKKGDLLQIPAGTVHAIMKGTVLYEVQEASDTTLRLYDWGRVDAAGKPRALHVRDALTILDMSAHGTFHIAPVVLEEPGYRHSYRIACRYFAIEEYTFERDQDIVLPAKQSFRVLSLMNGVVSLHYPGGNCDMRAGQTVLLPASLREVCATGKPGSLMLVSSVPDLQREIISPLRHRGVADAAIALLGGSLPNKNDLSGLL